MIRSLRQLFMTIVAVLFICAFVVPMIFLYSFSHWTKRFVSKATVARIDRFWDAIGKPYEAMTRVAK